MELLHIHDSFYLDSSKIKKNPIFIIVGSCNGKMEKYLTERYNDCKIYSLEPHPFNFNQLKRALSDKSLFIPDKDKKRFNNIDLSNVTCINKALVCDDSKTALLDGDGSTATTYKTKKGIEVDAINLKDLLKEYNLNKVDCVFYNAEGSEMEFLPYVCSNSVYKSIYQICLNFHTHVKKFRITKEAVDDLINQTAIKHIYDINNDRVSKIASLATGIPSLSKRYPCFLFVKRDCESDNTSA